MKYCFVIVLFLLGIHLCPAQVIVHIGHSRTPFTESPVKKNKKYFVLVSYPLIPDNALENTYDSSLKQFIIKPTLMVNGIIIENPVLLDSFRNKYDPKSIRKIKLLSKEQASKQGILSSDDGLLIITTKKRYHLRF